MCPFMADEYKRASAEQKRLYERVQKVLSKYQRKTIMKASDVEEMLNAPYPPGIHWEIEFRAVKEPLMFTRRRASLRADRD